MSVSLAGSTVVMEFATQNGTDEIEIPEEAREGDLLVLTILGGFKNFTDPFHPTIAECPDPRMTELFRGSLKQSAPPDHFNVWYGRVTEDRSPIQVLMKANGDGNVQHLSMWGLLGAIRSYGASGVSIDLSRQNTLTRWEEVPGEPIQPSQPGWDALPGTGTAALAIGASVNGIGGSTQSWERVNPPWRVVVEPGAYWRIGYLLTDEREVPATGNPNNSVQAWQVLMYGLNVDTEPVTRQFPRDDGRGLSAAPRLYPPSKSQRVVGGHL